MYKYLNFIMDGDHSNEILEMYYSSIKDSFPHPPPLTDLHFGARRNQNTTLILVWPHPIQKAIPILSFYGFFLAPLHHYVSYLIMEKKKETINFYLFFHFAIFPWLMVYFLLQNPKNQNECFLLMKKSTVNFSIRVGVN